MSIYEEAHMSSCIYEGKKREGIRSLGIGVVKNCKLTNMGPRNPIWIF